MYWLRQSQDKLRQSVDKLCQKHTQVQIIGVCGACPRFGMLELRSKQLNTCEATTCNREPTARLSMVMYPASCIGYAGIELGMLEYACPKDHGKAKYNLKTTPYLSLMGKAQAAMHSVDMLGFAMPGELRCGSAAAKHGSACPKDLPCGASPRYAV
jgi:hypothetical protein